MTPVRGPLCCLLVLGQFILVHGITSSSSSIKSTSWKQMAINMTSLLATDPEAVTAQTEFMCANLAAESSGVASYCYHSENSSCIVVDVSDGVHLGEDLQDWTCKISEDMTCTASNNMTVAVGRSVPQRVTNCPTESELICTTSGLKLAEPDVRPTCCPNHFNRSADTCLLLSTDSMTWCEARDWCKAQGGELLSVDKEEDMQAVTNLSLLMIEASGYSVYVWADVHKLPNSENWVWLNSARPLASTRDITQGPGRDCGIFCAHHNVRHYIYSGVCSWTLNVACSAPPQSCPS